MFSLQVQIRNLTAAVAKRLPEQQPITIRFGPLQVEIQLYDPHYSAGKRLLLEMEEPELQNLKSTYAFGLFMENCDGRFWSIVTLEAVQICQNYSCPNIVFYDDNRNQCYTFELSLLISPYNKPRLAKTVQAPQIQPNHPQAKINSFLYPSAQAGAIPKPPQPPKRKSKAEPSKTNNRMGKKTEKVSYGVANHSECGQVFEESIDAGVYIPPCMEFTNHDHEPTLPAFQSVEADKTKKIETPHMHLAEGKKLESPKVETFMSYSQFKDHNKKIKNDQPTKQQMREMARKEAESEFVKKQTEIMVPIPNPKTGTYTLVPLSSMSEAQIIEYAQKQQQAEELKRFLQEEEARKKKKEEKRLKKEAMVGKMGKQTKQNLAKQNIGLKKKFSKQKISQKNKQSSGSSQRSQQSSSSPQPKQIPQIVAQKHKHTRSRSNSYNEEWHPKQNQQEQKGQASQQQIYQSDFDSVSNAGSQLKSRISVRSSVSGSQKKKEKVNQSDISESMYDYQYSQEFDSFSQSVLSKNKRASISEISGSYTSMSNKK